MGVLFSVGEGRWFGLRVAGVRRLLQLGRVAVMLGFIYFRLVHDLTEGVWS